MDAFRWAVIGTGAIADKVMREVTATGRHRVTAAYSRTASSAGTFAEKYGAKAYPTLEEAVTAPDVDCVYIATPHSCHYAQTAECIKLGVPVLCEKAFTINAEQTDELARLAKEKSVYVSEAMWTRYNPITKIVKDKVKSGELGDIVSFEASFGYNMKIAGFPKRVKLPEYGGGALLDVGVYPISYAQMLLGAPDSMECEMSFFKDVRTDRRERVLLKYGGAECRLFSAVDKFTTCSGVVKGTKGVVRMPLFYRPTMAYINIFGGKKKLITSRAGYIHEFDGVAKAVREGRNESIEIPLSDSAEVMRILDGLRAASNFRYPDDIEKI